MLKLLKWYTAQFFNSAKEDVNNMPDFPIRSPDEFNFLSISEDDLLKLSQLNTSEAVGPDKIHPWILKGVVMVYLNHYHNSVVDWKQALVTLIFKIGSRYDPNIYCPVSVTSQLSL